ncbi:hypothetical protein ASPZODRAFT_1278953 [Penicilliopsis zonata CBS 506.65]|uniref:Uncharacterized protein n=1 Tax=Penicilliopsis zonata CBS 506.65 TaxID=1073090 RepID=A0A1L9S6R2_9EURO|nr:hypothetical protein ASPZODRAFT_1278953 [Penicilliopsis zonata CBS 506.65]OJJ42867.1 hypothetical protein ASPZODRAFT_1278953 [Penicilliopsis zonata CBS 506.65]
MHSHSPLLMSPSHSPSSPRPSPPPSLPHARSSTKSPAFHLGTLPRFHPAVYQSASTSTATTINPVNKQQQQQQPPSSPRQSRQLVAPAAATYRTSATSYREWVESITLPRTPSGPRSLSPSAPRLDPLRSPGPVTPLALEEAGNYLAAGDHSSSGILRGSTSTPGAAGHHYLSNAPSPDVVEMLIVREKDRARQQQQPHVRKTSRGQYGW